jgi:ADP-ribose pyrophosphatase YjhB (NUDIX family)
MKFCPQCRARLNERLFEGRSRSVCDECGFVDWKTPSPVAAGIVLHRERIILVKTSYHISEDTWGLPGGYVETGETADEAVVREIKEETDTDLQLCGFVGTYFLEKEKVNLLYLVFWGKTFGGEIRPGGDVEEVAPFFSRRSSQHRRQEIPLGSGAL